MYLRIQVFTEFLAPKIFPYFPTQPHIKKYTSTILSRSFRCSVSEEFILQAERIIAEASTLEAELAQMPDSEKQSKYENLIQQLEELINPPSDDEEDEDEE